MKSNVLFGSLAACLFAAAPALANVGEAKVTQFVPDGPLKAAEEGKTHWNRSLSLSVNMSLAQNSNMVGQIDGFSFLFGGGLVGTLDYLNGAHEFKNVLTLLESFAKTPVVDDLVKTNDLIRLETMYAYNFVSWAGVFGRLTFEAPILATNDIRADDTIFSVTRLDGKVETTGPVREFRLSDPLDPMTLSQSVGLVAKPFEAEAGTMTIRVGGGARETLAKGVLINKDDAATPNVELVEVNNIVQGGVELAIGLSGKAPAYKLTYGIDVGVLFPLLNNDDTDRGIVDLTRVGVAGAATFNFFDWLGLTYQLKILSDPQLIEGLQSQNNLLLTFKYDLVEAVAPEPPPPAPEAPEVTAAKAEAEAAKAKAAAAEEALKAAEDRAKAAEEALKAKEAVPPPPPAPETPTEPGNP